MHTCVTPKCPPILPLSSREMKSLSFSHLYWFFWNKSYATLRFTGSYMIANIAVTYGTSLAYCTDINDAVSSASLSLRIFAFSQMSYTILSGLTPSNKFATTELLRSFDRPMACFMHEPTVFVNYSLESIPEA